MKFQIQRRVGSTFETFKVSTQTTAGWSSELNGVVRETKRIVGVKEADEARIAVVVQQLSLSLSLRILSAFEASLQMEGRDPLFVAENAAPTILSYRSKGVVGSTGQGRRGRWRVCPRVGFRGVRLLLKECAIERT